ncbi:hypothetical protein FHS89_001772 [Rubricella aquisinus]|uniref:Uncharacterized protein n=1 Tax=Rubricella aquisinus TaxID=2028108 RepID=A0A840WQ13_9RHOB|nr:hypothetical protein [Rubricella aquisinus]MBB5515752.1 hypothetical protein [Rubricella aquisinus]
MTANPKTDVALLADKLAHALAKVEQEEPYIFTRSEVETLQSVIAFVEKLKALRWLGRGIFYLVVATGVLVSNWDRIKEAVLKWFA